MLGVSERKLQGINSKHPLYTLLCSLQSTACDNAGRLDIIEEYSTTDRLASGSVDIVAQLEHFSAAIVEVSSSFQFD